MLLMLVLMLVVGNDAKCQCHIAAKITALQKQLYDVNCGTLGTQLYCSIKQYSDTFGNFNRLKARNDGQCTNV